MTAVLLRGGITQLVTSPDLRPPKPMASTFLTGLVWLSAGPQLRPLVGEKAVVPKRSRPDNN